MKSKLYMLACIGLLEALIPAVRGDDYDQKTVFTFSAPVEIPGQVLLPGTYVFKLADSASDRNVAANRSSHLKNGPSARRRPSRRGFIPGRSGAMISSTRSRRRRR
jgi:hypothetical protein